MATRKTKPKPEPSTLRFSSDAYIAIPVREYEALKSAAAGTPEPENDLMFWWISQFKREADRWLPERLMNGKSDLRKRIEGMSAQQLLEWTREQV